MLRRCLELERDLVAEGLTIVDNDYMFLASITIGTFLLLLELQKQLVLAIQPWLGAVGLGPHAI